MPSPFGSNVGPPHDPVGEPSWLPHETPRGQHRGGLIIAIILAVIVIAAAGFVIAGRDDETDEARPANGEQTEDTDATAATDPSIVTVSTAPITEPDAIDLFTGTQAAEVVAQFATARAASPLRILEVHFYPEYSFIQVQDPAIPANVDQFDWRDHAVSPSTPVRMSSDTDLEALLFSDTEVNWAAIPVLAEAALTQVPIEGAEVTHIVVHRTPPFSDEIKIRVFVDGTRTSGYVDADSQGNITFVDPG